MGKSSTRTRTSSRQRIASRSRRSLRNCTVSDLSTSHRKKKIMIKSKIKTFALATTIAYLAAAPLSPAEDWPRWGGNDPGRNMYSPAKGLPARFDPGKFKQGTEEEIDLATTKNV